MKKTFAAIALTFVATTAYAADSVDLETKVIDIDVARTDWIWSVNVDDEGKATTPEESFSFDINDNWEIDLTFVSTASSGANQWGTCILATGDNPTAGAYPGGFQLYLNVSGGLVIKAGSSGPISADENHTFVPNGVMSGKGTYTVSLVHFGTVLRGTVFDSTGAQLASQAWENVQWADGTTVTQFCTNISDSMITNNDWQRPTVSVKSVPEPATATLGLLALAGLAARRRRK